MKLVFEVEIDDEGMAEYLIEYPGFALDGEEPIDVLVREAIAAWDTEGLIEYARLSAALP